MGAITLCLKKNYDFLISMGVLIQGVCWPKFLVSHNPNIKQEINGNGLKHVANFVSFSIFSLANGYVANGHCAPCLLSRMVNHQSNGGLVLIFQH
jgi:hypothetical protein